MRRRQLSFVLPLFLLLVAGAIFLARTNLGDPPEGPSSRGEQTEEYTEAEVGPLSPAHERSRPRDHAPPSPAAPLGKETWRWLDPEGKAFRRRVQIEHRDFKYPHVRRIERVSHDVETGEERLELLEASVADHVLAGLKAGVPVAEAQAALERRGFRVRAVEPGAFLLVDVPNFMEPGAQDQTLRALAALDEFIDYSEPDYLVWPSVEPNDPSFVSGKLWGLENPGTVIGTRRDADIDAPAGWDEQSDASSVVVAVIDTGIRHSHEDLRDNLWTNPGEIPGDLRDNDGNGVIDDLHGFDAEQDDGDPDDDNGHGTHVAGTIGAKGNNGIGGTGVAWNVQLMGVRFLSEAGGTTSDAIRAVNYARLNGAHLINASWGGPSYSQGLYNAIAACEDAGILFVAAAGNEASDNDATPHYPSSYDLGNVIAVTATTRLDEMSSFANTGRYSVDLAAPGSDILSTFHRHDGDYRALNGTSMAAPHVTGALALAKASHPGDSAHDLLTRLLSSVELVPHLFETVSSAGRLNLENLLARSSPLPAHDAFDQAYQFTGNYGAWTGSNRRATREVDEDSFSRPNTGSRSLWFTWTAPFDGLVQLDSEASDPTTAIVFRGQDRNTLALAEQTSSPGLRSSLRFYAEEGETYYFLLDSDSASGTSITLRFSLTAANDHLTTAEALAEDTFRIQNDNRGATAEPYESTRPHAGVGRGQSLWWRWTPSSSGDFVLSTAGSSFDTVLAVYTGDPAKPDELSEVASNDDRSEFDWTSQVEFAARAGTSYFIAVDSYDPDGWGPLALTGGRIDQIVVVQEPQDLQARVGDRVRISAGVAGSGLHYQWELDGEPIPGAIHPTYTISPVSPAHFGTYRLRVTNTAIEVLSRSAVLTELRTPPAIQWLSQNRTGSVGESISLAVNAEGSVPLSYQWSKNGAPIPGKTDKTLRFPSLELSDEGLYSVAITNDQGSVASRQIGLLVAETPWAGFQHLNPLAESGPIQKILRVRGLWVAIGSAEGSARLQTSSDGVLWKDRYLNLPGDQRFEPTGIAHGNGLWLVTGSNGVLRSNDLETWEALDITLSEGDNSLHDIIFHDNAFFARSPFSNHIYRSEDGSAWEWQGAPVAKTFVSAPPGLLAVVNGERRGWFLPAGGRWQRVTFAEVWGAHRGVWFKGKYMVYGLNGTWSVSTNGTSWTETRLLARPLDEDSFVFQQGGRLYAGRHSTYYVTSDGEHWEEAHLDGSAIAAAATEEQVVLGNVGGVLFAGQTIDAVEFPEPFPIPPSKLYHENGQFVVVGGVHSIDGETWKSNPVLDISRNEQEYFGNRVKGAAGRFWYPGSSDFGETIPLWRGEVAAAVRVETFTDDPDEYLLDLVEGPVGLLAVAAKDVDRSFFIRLVHSEDEGETWTAVAFPDGLFSPRVGRMGDLYYVDRQAHNSTWVSFDLQTWRDLGFAGDEFVFHEGEYWVLHDGKFSRSSDGMNWDEVVPTGSPQFHVLDLVSFNGALVGASQGALVYSYDGIDWIGLNPGFDVIGVASSEEILVALGKRGELARTGAPTSLGPVVDIVSPADRSTFVEGSVVQIECEVFDPDSESSAVVRCYVDGVLVGEGREAPYTFATPLVGNGGHLVHVVAEDDEGIRGDDHLVLWASVATGRNVLRSSITRVPLPGPVHYFDGRFYATGDREILSSVDGKEWERAELPAGVDDIGPVRFGSGAIVAPLPASGSEQQALVTNDGMNWNIVELNGLDSDLYYSNGTFFGFDGPYILKSADGQIWERQVMRNRFDGSFRELEGDPNGILIIRSFQDELWHSLDGGISWKEFSFPETPMSMRYDGTRFVVATRTNNSRGTLRTSADGESWTTHNPGTGVNGVRLAGGTFFAFKDLRLRSVSPDGLRWNNVNVLLDPENLASAEDGFFYSLRTQFDSALDRHVTSLLRSRMGASWETVSVDIPPGELKVGATGVFLAGDSGEFWRWTEEEQSWVLLNSIDAPPLDFRVEAVASDGERIVAVAGSGQVFSTPVDRDAWEPIPAVEGIGTDTWLYYALEFGGAFLISDLRRSVYLHSTDGFTFTDVTTELAPLDFISIGVSETEWLGISADGSVRRSTDGLIWELHAPAGAFPENEMFDLKWTGTQWLGSSKRQIYRSADGVTWSAEGQPTISGPGQFTVTKAGILAAAGRFDYHFSRDGESWEFVRILGNYVFGDGERFYRIREGWLESSIDVITWTPQLEVEPELSDGFFEEGRMFLGSSTKLIEVADRDSALSSLVVPAGSYGVGDELPVRFELRNAREGILASGRYTVDLWFSRDGFAGNLDDLSLGSIEIDLPEVAAGEVLPVTVPALIPEGIEPARYHVGVKLSSPASVVEHSLGNNRLLTATAPVEIPGWQLDVATFGDGEVRRDQFGVLYAHGSQISLSAQAGKGATFAGWGGDAVGGLSQVTILMDQDRTVEATFEPAVSLQVRVFGAGEVSGAEEGGIYETGTIVSLDAQPDPGWVFAGWSGAAQSPDPDLDLTVNQASVVTAHFTFPIENWRAIHFTPAELGDPEISSDNADADGDGLSNRREYIHGTNPRSAASRGWHSLRATGGHLSLVYTRQQGSAEGFAVQVQGSRDHERWDEDVEERVLKVADGVETREARLPVAGHQHGFLRFDYR